MLVIAGIVLAAFGGGGAWLLASHYPNARFLRTGYALMGLGGICCIVWALSKNVVLGVAAAGVLAVGGVIGAVGALRKELRF